jgi:DNA-binding MarR family transcriptional regulator
MSDPKTQPTPKPNASPGPSTPLRAGDSFDPEFPDASRSASECGMNLVRTADLVLAEVSRRRRPLADLSPTAWQILAVVEGAGEPLPPGAIAERLLVTSGTMTSLLDTLERRGLIRRTPHPADRRKLLIDITPEARNLVDSMLPRVHAGFRDIFAPLDEGDRATLLELLGRLQASLRELAAAKPSTGPERRVKP